MLAVHRANGLSIVAVVVVPVHIVRVEVRVPRVVRVVRVERTRPVVAVVVRVVQVVVVAIARRREKNNAQLFGNRLILTQIRILRLQKAYQHFAFRFYTIV